MSRTTAAASKWLNGYVTRTVIVSCPTGGISFMHACEKYVLYVVHRTSEPIFSYPPTTAAAPRSPGVVLLPTISTPSPSSEGYEVMRVLVAAARPGYCTVLPSPVLAGGARSALHVVPAGNCPSPRSTAMLPRCVLMCTAVYCCAVYGVLYAEVLCVCVVRFVLRMLLLLCSAVRCCPVLSCHVCCV